MNRTRAKAILNRARSQTFLVLGDVILDQFIWGGVSRISPEAPVPIVEFKKESFMPGGAGNVARNLADLGIPILFAGFIGKDDAGRKVRSLLHKEGIDCSGLLASSGRETSVKTRIVAQQQQIVRLDRETKCPLTDGEMKRLVAFLEPRLSQVRAIVCGDYGKGVITQSLLEVLKRMTEHHGIWLSLDPKPVHRLQLEGLSLLTPNRKEAFELADIRDEGPTSNPQNDRPLLRVIRTLQKELGTRILLITLGEQGMMVCERGAPPIHIPTVAQEVFDVSGAGDTVIATFTLAIASGATPLESAILANHAAGVVVGKLGTATVTEKELLHSFQSANRR